MVLSRFFSFVLYPTCYSQGAEEAKAGDARLHSSAFFDELGIQHRRRYRALLRLRQRISTPKKLWSCRLTRYPTDLNIHNPRPTLPLKPDPCLPLSSSLPILPNFLIHRVLLIPRSIHSRPDRSSPRPFRRRVEMRCDLRPVTPLFRTPDRLPHFGYHLFTQPREALISELDGPPLVSQLKVIRYGLELTATATSHQLWSTSMSGDLPFAKVLASLRGMFPPIPLPASVSLVVLEYLDQVRQAVQSIVLVYPDSRQVTGMSEGCDYRPFLIIVLLVERERLP